MNPAFEKVKARDRSNPLLITRFFQTEKICFWQILLKSSSRDDIPVG